MNNLEFAMFMVGSATTLIFVASVSFVSLDYLIKLCLKAFDAKHDFKLILQMNEDLRLEKLELESRLRDYEDFAVTIYDIEEWDNLSEQWAYEGGENHLFDAIARRDYLIAQGKNCRVIERKETRKVVDP